MGGAVSDLGLQHYERLRRGLDDSLEHIPRLRQWGEELGSRLAAGCRLLAAGNGGSAAQAQHLTAELVGRYRVDRRPFSAIALHADTSSLTSIVNDYGSDEMFARQVRAHGRRGDVLVALSTSGGSTNVIRSVVAAREAGMDAWALTGPFPNELAHSASDAVSFDVDSPATVQELHLVAVHLLCAFVDAALDARDRPVARGAPGG